MTISLLSFFLLWSLSYGTIFGDEFDSLEPSTVFAAIFVRNEASTLPYFLTSFTNLEYPKSRMRVWIYRNPEDEYASHVLKIWVEIWRSQYHSIHITTGNTTDFEKLALPDSTEEKYKYMINLREEALETAKRLRADYIWFLDCDALLVDPQTLNSLMKHALMIVAPLLHSDDMYSNFWCGMTSSYYYKRTDEYEEILYKKKVGCFMVPMIHSAVLIDLRDLSSDKLTFNPNKIADYDGPVDDMITFAVGANKSGLQLYVCNDRRYGYIIVPTNENENDTNHLSNLKLHVTVNHPPLRVDNSFAELVELPPKSKFGFSEIFIINLKRRTERRARMKYCIDELGIDAKFVDAVDGKSLGKEEFSSLGIKLMPGYEDPYHKRPMKNGEIGCFLSHYNIWQEVIDKRMHVALILEDDVHFGRNFIQKLEYLVYEISHFSSMWDIVYIGRKIMNPKEEDYLNGSNILVLPDYSYWTIGYIISWYGAQKLVNAEPLSKLLPVDEFLPIMYDRHPRLDWKAYFPVRNLRALSVNPLIISPMKYTNEEGYVSDTEDSHIVNKERMNREEL